MDRNHSTTPEREKGQHLRFEDRCSIKTCKKLRLSLRKTAAVVGCAASTVLNELRRGTGVRNGNRGRFPEYSAKRGQANYEINRSRCHRDSNLDPNSPFIEWVVKQVKEHGWSLDACVGRAKKRKLFPKEQIFCTSTLYDAVWAGKIPLSPFDLPEALSRKQTKHASRKNKRVLGKSIDERPEEAMMRIVCGHWEIDTVVGKRSGKESVVLTLVEKVTDFYLAIKIPGKDSASVMAAMEVLRDEYGEEKFSEIFKTSLRTTAASLRLYPTWKTGESAYISPIHIHPGRELKTNDTTACSADMFQREYPLITTRQSRSCHLLMR